MRIFLQLSYDGTPFNGWQVQPDRPSVQETLEQAFETVLHTHVKVTGAGRTDTGVHARTMVAHADIPDDFKGDPAAMRRLHGALGGICRPAIAIHALTPVADDAHARFDATARTYRYMMHTAENPFIRSLSWRAPADLDFDAMNRAAALVIGRRDFTSFSKLHTDTKTNICDVTTCRMVRQGPTSWYLEIRADRFLRNMVRAVTGTLVDIGRHKHAPEHVAEVIAAMDRAAAGTSMPAHALYLWDIEYPYYQTIQI